MDILAHRRNCEPLPTPLLNCKEKVWLQAQVRIGPLFPFLHTIFPANNFIFSITWLFTIHGLVDISAHRRNCATPLPTPCPPLQREGVTASAGGNFFLFPFLICHFPSWYLVYHLEHLLYTPTTQGSCKTQQEGKFPSSSHCFPHTLWHFFNQMLTISFTWVVAPV